MEYIFSKRTLKINPSLIGQMSIWANEVEGVEKSFGQGIPSENLPDSLKVKLIEAIKEKGSINKYTLKSGMPELKKQIALDINKRKITDDITEKEIGLTAGCIGALFSAILAIVKRGDEVVIFSPAYPPHIEIVKIAEGKPVFVSLLEKENWRPDLGKLEKSITKKTKMLIICNPSNPTGFVFSREELKEIIKITSKKNIFLVSDETYDFLTYEGSVHHSLLSFPESRERAITCFSFSKRFFMTGFRVGFVVSRKGILEEILKIHDQSNICVSTLSQYAALFAFQPNIRKDFEDLHKNFIRKRELTLKRIKKLSRFFEWQPPKGAYYIFPKIKFSNLQKKISPALERKIEGRFRKIKKELQTPDFKFCLELLFGAKVLTIPGIIFGPHGKGHIRISFGGSIEKINESFDRIERYLK